MSESTRDWLLKKVIKMGTSLAEMHVQNRELVRDLEGAHREIGDLSERIDVLTAADRTESEEVAELKARIAEMSPQKMFRVQRKLGSTGAMFLHEIIAVRSSNGETVITIV